MDRCNDACSEWIVTVFALLLVVVVLTEVHVTIMIAACVKGKWQHTK